MKVILQLDDDCDAMTLDDDLDQDGFVLSKDCDDTNSEINLDAMEIPNTVYLSGLYLFSIQVDDQVIRERVVKF